jgi:DNA-binding response OmpR family regulator
MNDSMSIPRKFDTSASTPVRVIFLEDDHVLRRSLTDFLSLNSISVVDVASIAAFRKAISEQEFDIALVDLGLPDGSGFDVARQLQGSTLGLIIITARAGRAERLQGYQEGADLFFTKPVDGTELVLAIRNLARRVTGLQVAHSSASQHPAQRRAASKAATEQKEWHLDLTGHRLLAPSGTMIKLSGREAAFIGRLAQAGGNVVSRDHLAAALGYKHVDTESRRVDAVLRRLRHKAREADVELPVHAVHSQGFRFSGQLSSV